MKINFVLPFIGLSGGVKVVFEYANLLTEEGHDVKVIYPFIDKGSKLKSIIKLINSINPLHNSSVKWFDLKATLLPVPTLNERFIPDADIIVATWWETAHIISDYKPRKGEKFYLIQSYEDWGGPKEEVDDSYKLGLHNIVISNWLKYKIESVGGSINKLIFNGVDFNEFYPDKKTKSTNEIRILMPYRPAKLKGMEDGLKAIELVRNKHKNIKLVLFGPEPNIKLPDFVEFHVYPISGELRELYNSCDLFLFPSHFEGFGLPPMEAMACKIPVATTNVGAIPDYTIPGKTALVSEPHSPQDLAENLIKLIDDKNLRSSIAKAGYEYIQQFNWESSKNKLENLFKYTLMSNNNYNSLSELKPVSNYTRIKETTS